MSSFSVSLSQYQRLFILLVRKQRYKGSERVSCLILDCLPKRAPNARRTENSRFYNQQFQANMIEHSAISSKSIYDKFCKLQRTASDQKFRAKSLRVKTINHELQDHLIHQRGLPAIYPNQSLAHLKTANLQNAKLSANRQLGQSKVKARVHSYKIIEKNYQQELNNNGIDSQFLTKVFLKKCEETESKNTQHKYQIFVKNLCLRMCNSKSLEIHQMGLAQRSLDSFFEWYTRWDGHITQVDLTYAEDLLKDSKMKVIKELLAQDQKLLKIMLCNSSLDGTQIADIFKIVNEQQRLFCLDIGNVNSQCLNRLGSDYSIVEDFFYRNESVAIVKLNNIQLRREGFESLCKGLIDRKTNPLKILSLQSNNISGGKVCQAFYNLAKSGLTHLNFSFNPLGDQFFKTLPILKGITLRQLVLMQTDMNSENLYELFEKIEQSKTLTVLKVDQNDFSHHWFGKLGQKLEVNSSLVSLSLNSCKISTFLPLFQGLMHNKVLKRLDANKNCLDCTQDISKQIVDCFTFNKELEELRFRFCNINQETMVKLFDGLRHNKRLKVLDISENMLQDLAATKVLKMLQQNTSIRSIGIEKLQISQQMKKRILMKLQENSAIRQREEEWRLKNQTKEMKAKDSSTWDDLKCYEEEERKLEEKVKKLSEKNQKLEEKISKKKTTLTQLIATIKSQAQAMEKQVQDRLRLGNEMVRNRQRELEQLIEKEDEINIARAEQQELIQRLEASIRASNRRNKERENELEDKLRNHRYLQRKKSKQQQLVFHSPRKSSNCAAQLAPK